MFKYMRIFGRSIRNYATKAEKSEKIKYTSTINLPKTKFENRLTVVQRSEIEQYLLQTTLSKAFKHQALHNSEPTFVLHDGPPYANGDLHMGHAVNKILKDITLRKQLLKGLKVDYTPGWDCHGLPIELKAMAAVNDEEKDPLTIRTNCRSYALDAYERQKQEFRSWGVLSDWDDKNGVYLTIQPEFIVNEMQMFAELYKKGLVYRELKPVFWSPSSGTALAESELEYNDQFISPSLFLRFALTMPLEYVTAQDQRVYALVWTTTPWTLPSNQAICYNKDLDYVLVKLEKPNGTVLENELYLIAQNLVQSFEQLTQYKCLHQQPVTSAVLSNITYQHPMDETKLALPFLNGSHVQDSKGTGLVHTAPAHGPDDFLISLQYKLPVISLVSEQGLYTKEAPEFLHEKYVLSDGNDLVLQHLKQDIVHLDKIQHSYPIDWRTKQPVIIRASDQWFINTEALKERAVQEISKVDIYPRVNADASKKSMIQQIQKRPYWCISRQRIWGVPIPVFYHKTTGAVVTNSKIIDRICELTKQLGNVDFWWSMSIQEILPSSLLDELNLKADDLIKGKDIFDIWFDSGSTWSSVLKGDKIADVYLEGYDQFTGWFQSSLLISVAMRQKSPYKSLFVHGFTVDEKGHKMSKSLGNVISPTDITKRYGVDVLRWWVALHATQNMSIIVSDKLLKQSADSLNKIRATLRYMNGAIGARKLEASIAPISTNRQNHLNKYLLSSLVDFHAELMQYYEAYEYNRVVATINNFVANQISGIYVNLIKDRLYCGDNKEYSNVRFTLSRCYEIMCKALWPIMPFLVEESWQHYEPKSPFHEQLITLDEAWRNPEIVNIVNTALEAKRLINQQAGDVNTWQLAVNIKCTDPNKCNALRKLQPVQNTPVHNSELTEILQVGSATLNLNNTVHNDAVPADGASSFDIYIAPIATELCPRCRRFSLSFKEKVCIRCLNVLKLKGREVL